MYNNLLNKINKNLNSRNVEIVSISKLEYSIICLTL